MLTLKEKLEIEELQRNFKNIIKDNKHQLYKINAIEKRMNEILEKVPLLERLCINEIIFDPHKDIYKLLTRPINLAYATQEVSFTKNQDFQHKFQKAMELRKNGYLFLDCFRIKGIFENDKFICTRIKFCDKYDTEGNEYLQLDFPDGILEKGTIEKRKKGIVSHEELMS